MHTRIAEQNINNSVSKDCLHETHVFVLLSAYNPHICAYVDLFTVHGGLPAGQEEARGNEACCEGMNYKLL